MFAAAQPVLGLSPLPFYVDTMFCLLIGGGILLGYFKAGLHKERLNGTGY